MGRLLSKIIGEYRFTVAEEMYVPLLNVVREESIWIYSTKAKDDEVTFFASVKDSKKLLAVCNERQICIKISRLLGLPGFFLKYRRRYGAFAGAALFVISVFMSRYFIWDFKIVGNESIPDDIIIAGLEDLGCTYGSFIPAMDFEMIANDFLLESDDIAWISVNMKSSLAVVEVLERKKGEPLSVVTSEGTYANITSSEDAEIILPEINSGKSVVHPGDTVKSGALLATGVISVGEDGVRYEYASGKVLGKVYREIQVSVPLNGEKKVYTGRSRSNKFVKIFGKTKNLFGNSSIDYTKYDKIEEEKQLTFFGSVTVPVWLGNTVFSEYSHERCEYTESEAKTMAKIEFSDMLDELLEEGEIVSMETEEGLADGEYRITCRIYLIKDIAVLSEFTVSDNTVKGVTG